MEPNWVKCNDNRKRLPQYTFEISGNIKNGTFEKYKRNSTRFLYHGNYVFIAYLVLIMFWVLDGFFLSQERLFRALYNDVRKFEEKDIDFSMNRDKYKKDPKNSWICSTFSPTLLCFYVPLIIIMLLITYSMN